MTSPEFCAAPFKALILGRNIPLHPDPRRPILKTRGGHLPMGLGGRPLLPPRASGSGKVVAKVVPLSQRNQQVTPKYYRTTAKTRSLHVRVCMRARICAINQYIGSTVVDNLKSLAAKGKSHYFAHYFATTSDHRRGSGSAKSLKNLKKGDF